MRDFQPASQAEIIDRTKVRDTPEKHLSVRYANILWSKLHCCLWMALVSASLLTDVAANARPFTARDLAMLDRISAPRISPDGRFVTYTTRSTDWDRNSATYALSIVDRHSSGGKPRTLTSGDKVAPSARWSSDGRWIYFLSYKSGSSQIWRTTPQGQSLAQVTALPIDIETFQLTPDSKSLIVSANIYQDCPTLACTRIRNDQRASIVSSGLHFKEGPIRFWDSYEDERYVGLFRIAIDKPGAPTEAVRLSGSFRADLSADNSDLAMTATGSTIYFVSRDPKVDEGGNAVSRLYSVAGDGSAPPRHIAGTSETSITSPALSRDGRWLAYLSRKGPYWIFGRTSIVIRDLKSGAERDVAPRLDLRFSRLSWSADGKKLLGIAEDNGQAPLLSIEPATGRLDRVTRDGEVSDFDTAGELTVYVMDSMTAPAQIFASEQSGAAEQLTHAGAGILSETVLSEPERFEFRGWNDEPVHGYILKPHGYVAGKSYPVVLLIHGGPHSNFGNGWSYRWNPQVWAGMGYAVVTIDFHGSSGYGEAFGRSIVGHWGDRPLEDLQKGWAYVLSKYPFLDEARACAIGGSYGGYMVNWIASRWQTPWKCLVNHAGIFDLGYNRMAMDLSAFTDTQFGGSPKPEDIARFSPAPGAGNWKVPMLVIHGGKDFRVSMDQAIATYNAARSNGVPAEFLLFPDENHWILKPQNSVQWYGVMQKWLDRWLVNDKSGGIAEDPPNTL